MLFPVCPSCDILMLMKSRLGRIFIIQVVVFIVAILGIAYLMFYRLSVKNVERRVADNFRAELTIMAQDVEHMVNIAVENTAALSSRTMIRTALCSYHNGAISLEDLRDYTQSKYEDGAAVYDNLLFARRVYLDGTAIAYYGDGEAGLPEFSESGHVVFLPEGDSYSLAIQNPIMHNGIHLGYDTAVFGIGPLIRSQALFLENPQIRPSGENTGEIENLAVPIGNTGWFLHATLRDDVMARETGAIRRSVLLLSGLLILLVMVVSWFTILRLTLRLVRERDEVNKRLSRSLDEKDYLLKELHHRVKNNLSLITSFIGLQSASTDNEELKERNRVLISRINAVSLVHEKLQHSDGVQDVDIGIYLQELCKRIIESGRGDDISLSADLDEGVVVPIKRAISIGLIFAELTINALKHAAVDGRLGIRIGLKREGENLVCTYSDDGKPFPEDFDPSAGSSLGLKVVDSLAEQLEGNVRYDVSEGKTITITLPTQDLPDRNPG